MALPLTTARDLVAAPATTAEPAQATAVRTRVAVSAPRLVAGVAVTSIGLLVLGFVAYLTGASSLQANHRQTVLYQRFRAELAQGTAPLRPVAVGRPVALLEIPALGTRQVVVEGSSSRDMVSGPGHEPDTVMPGEQGTSVILGKRATAGAPFRRVDRIAVGDSLIVVSGAGRLVYRVDSRWRSDLAHPAPPAAASRITLVTSDPGWTARRSLVVSAALLSGTAAAADVPAAGSPADLPLHGDTGAALPLYLWAQLAFLVVALLVRYHARLRLSVMWVGALPLLLVVVWHIYGALAALLPNTL